MFEMLNGSFAQPVALPEKLQSRGFLNLEIAGILLTKFDSRTKLSEQVEEVLRRGFPEKAFRTVIKVNVELIRAQIEKKSIFAVDPDSTGAKDYESLIDEILHREQSTKVIPILRRSARGNRKA